MPYLPNSGRYYFDGDFTKPTAMGLPVFDSPFEWSTKNYVLTQEFIQTLDGFAALALNTVHGDTRDGSVWPSGVKYNSFPNAYVLVDESPVQDMGSGVVKWTRTYATVPDTFSVSETFAYNFIGFLGQTGVNVTSVTGRERFTRSVISRVQTDFFLVSTQSNPIANPIDNKVYYSDSEIPFIRAQRYYYPANPANPETAANPFFDVDYIGDSPPFAIPTVPSRTTYYGWILNAQKYGWKSGIVRLVTVPPAASSPATVNPGQIPVEDSRISRWMGNIWQRQTRYVLAL